MADRLIFPGIARDERAPKTEADGQQRSNENKEPFFSSSCCLMDHMQLSLVLVVRLAGLIEER
jgi:hypothetical protein